MDDDSAGIDHKAKMMVRWDRERAPLEAGVGQRVVASLGVVLERVGQATRMPPWTPMLERVGFRTSRG